MSTKALAYGASAISIVAILAVVADFYRRFHYGMSMPVGVSSIGLFAVAAGVFISRIGRDSQH